ncbi:hypothetical protein [Novosphingobium sp. SCN 63-17]|uniref:hypothetical protein n=1 Tax=Novosphingobium sp. SCN 63-17 TaxID=1660120 RepID=UPI000868C878|nr:hypothetical protein [Novosphingobium sp. SCN 63-17]ODU81651.1 MAG: hypothetical protein ABT10_13510 [Novosphingobium sp. SCN 63-17]
MTTEPLSEQLERLGKYGSNALDVQIEIALFEPGTCYSAIRSNAAGTKVIYTDRAGNEVTCWAQDWSQVAARKKTLEALRAKEGE